jgi:hypothetical protein
MKPEPKDHSPLPCDDCAFQVAVDNSAFFCVRQAPVAQTVDGRAQWPKIERGGAPEFKGCGDGRRRKDIA